MNKEEMEKLFSEMTNCDALMNIDADDIRVFKASVNDYDGEKLTGENAEAGELLRQAIDAIKKRNEGYTFTRMLLSVNTSSDGTFSTDHLSRLHDVLNSIHLECIWQMSMDKELHGEEISVTVILG